MNAAPGIRTEVDVASIVVALSDALDLVGSGIGRHGKRVAYFAVRAASRLDWPEGDVEDLYLASMIHDCGVSSSRQMTRILGEGPEPPLGEHELDGHCERGSRLLAGFPPFERLSRVVRHHHATWEALQRTEVDPGVARIASLVRLADHADALSRRSGGGRFSLDEVGRAGNARRGDDAEFAPGLVEALRASCAPAAAWFGLEPTALGKWVAETRESVVPRMQPLASLRALAEIFARIVDAKSPYTADHSFRVARLSRFLGAQAGLSVEDVEDLEIAGLLHDLGMLCIPDEVLEKDGSLTDHERTLVERHPFETWEILRRVDVFRSISGWAAWHHEQLDGGGYPFGLKGDDLPFPARIVAVADGFQALAADRPYRRSLSPEAAVARLWQRVEEGQLDGAVVRLVEGALEECVLLANGAARS